MIAADRARCSLLKVANRDSYSYTHICLRQPRAQGMGQELGETDPALRSLQTNWDTLLSNKRRIMTQLRLMEAEISNVESEIDEFEAKQQAVFVEWSPANHGIFFCMVLSFRSMIPIVECSRGLYL